MINSNKIKQLIENSSNVVIVSHKNIDLDALGTDLGLYFICKSFGKDAYIIVEDETFSPEIRRALSTIEKKDNITIKKYSDIKRFINDKTLLIIADTNKKSRLQNIELLEIKDKVLIDHHIKSDDEIQDLIYEYIDTNESSAAEIAMDLINEFNTYIPSEIATIMLSGIYIDTNGFILKTNENTHSCAATLYSFGADNKEASRLLKQNFNEYKRRQALIMKTEFYNEVAITISDELIYNTIELAKACDVLLTFNHVEAAYVIAKIDENTIGISARSLGNIDVEELMTHFGGGGHKTDAGAQVKESDVFKIKENLLNYIGG